MRPLVVLQDVVGNGLFLEGLNHRYRYHGFSINLHIRSLSHSGAAGVLIDFHAGDAMDMATSFSVDFQDGLVGFLVACRYLIDSEKGNISLSD